MGRVLQHSGCVPKLAVGWGISIYRVSPNEKAIRAILALAFVSRVEK